MKYQGISCYFNLLGGCLVHIDVVFSSGKPEKAMMDEFPFFTALYCLDRCIPIIILFIYHELVYYDFYESD